MEKNSEPNKTFTHKVKRFLTKVVRSCNKERQYPRKEFWENLTFICQVMRLSSAQSRSRVQLFAIPWTAAYQAFLSITDSQGLLELMSIESVIQSNPLIFCCPLLLLPSIFPSIRVFPNESFLYIKWPKYWSFSFSISISNEYSGLISFRMGWLNLQIFCNTTVQKHQFYGAQLSLWSNSYIHT